MTPNSPPLYATQRSIDTHAIQSLLDICAGLCADDQINNKEVLYLKTWLSENSSVTSHWPGSAIAKRIDDILADGTITKEENEDLLGLLRTITASNFNGTGATGPDSPALPIDENPTIQFRDMTFSLAGNFFFGTRTACEHAIIKMGGMAIDRVYSRLNYLVIGGLIEPTWAFTNHGRKIESAVKLKESGSEIVIISEQQWALAIDLNRKS